MYARDAAFFDEVASALNYPRLDVALARVLAVIVGELGAAAGWIWLTEAKGGRFYLAAAERLPPYLRSPVEMTGEPCWCMDSFVDGDFDHKSVDIVSCSRLRKGQREAGADATGGLLSHASVALRFGEYRLGLLNVCPLPGNRLEEAQLRILSAAGAQIGLAVERARLAERDAQTVRLEERTRLARELHDTLAQDLVAIALQLELALQTLVHTTPAASAVAKALGFTRTALEQARSSVAAWRVSGTPMPPLASALGELAREFTSETGIPVAAVLDGSHRLAEAVEREVFAIAVEAFANIRQHARASHVDLSLRRCDDGVRLTIRDDGVGFAPDHDRGGRFGIVGMKERAAAAGAGLAIASAPEAGTLVEIRLGLGG